MELRKLMVWGGVLVGGVLLWQMFGGSGEARVFLRDGSAATGAEIATPLTGSAGVQMRGRIAVFSLALSDAKGRPLKTVQLPGGGRPDAPRVVVTDADGRQVYQAKLAYG